VSYRERDPDAADNGVWLFFRDDSDHRSQPPSLPMHCLARFPRQHRERHDGVYHYLQLIANQHSVRAQRYPRPKRRTMVLSICRAAGLAAFAVAGLALTARYVRITNHVVLIAAALSPFLVLAAPVSVVLLAAARRWILTVAALALTGTVFASQAPMYVASAGGPGAGVSVRVMTLNLALGRALPTSVVEAAGEHADILAVQELTPRAVERLSAAGLDAALPYRTLDPREHASGVGLWSRYPIPHTWPINGYGMPFIGAQIQVSGVAINPIVVVVHLSAPWPQPISDWRNEVDRLPKTLQETAESAANGSVIVLGDFNSTLDMRPIRDMLRHDYEDAAEQAGVATTATFPANAWLPPLLAIDHILTRRSTPTSLYTVAVPGSDHRALVATIKLP
jgi:endonuclease/exonuclease/phosphatase (EEP) superfamily protein YafD